LLLWNDIQQSNMYLHPVVDNGIRFRDLHYLNFLFVRFISSWSPNILNILKFTNIFLFSLKLQFK